MLIEQEVDHDLAHDHPSEIEPHGAFEGGGPEKRNLVNPIDHAAVASGIDEDEIPKSPEMLSLIDDQGVITVSESKLRRMVRRLISRQRSK